MFRYDFFGSIRTKISIYIAFYYFLGLNMFLVPINMSTFHFSPSKIFLQLLVLKIFSIFTFGPYFKITKPILQRGIYLYCL